MVRLSTCVLALSCFLVPSANAEAPAKGLTVGFGSDLSCSKWLHEGVTRGSNWILGYWSGRNVEGSASRRVGTTADDDEIIEEMTAICEAEPSITVPSAVDKVYERFLKENR